MKQVILINYLANLTEKQIQSARSRNRPTKNVSGTKEDDGIANGPSVLTHFRYRLLSNSRIIQASFIDSASRQLFATGNFHTIDSHIIDYR